ncbi:MAG: SBBP repeat-containing protein, partial [Gammaproteobacteria bacterium]
VYSTYLGGTSDEDGRSIAVDRFGQAYVVGLTSSTDFPTRNPLQPTLGGFSDAFVAKLNRAGSKLVYSTYLGGDAFTDSDEGHGIAVDRFGQAYVTGFTRSTDFPTQNPLQPAFGGGLDAFVAKLNRAGSKLVYSTYLGGTGDDFGRGIAVDPSGHAYVTGDTNSTDFPTQDPLQPASGGDFDAFVTKISP